MSSIDYSLVQKYSTNVKYGLFIIPESNQYCIMLMSSTDYSLVQKYSANVKYRILISPESVTWYLAKYQINTIHPAAEKSIKNYLASSYSFHY